MVLKLCESSVISVEDVMPWLSFTLILKLPLAISFDASFNLTSGLVKSFEKITSKIDANSATPMRMN